MSGREVKLVYIAGPYAADTGWGIDCNIQAARRRGAEVAAKGVMPIVPHANTAHYDGIQPHDFWLAGTLELMRRCDAVMLLRNWEQSGGARAEVEEALRLGLPVFQTMLELTDWLRTGAWVLTDQCIHSLSP